MNKLDSGHVLLLLSGGVDSTCCLSYLKSTGYKVECLFIDYGQASAHAEIAAAQNVASYYEIALSTISILHKKKLGQGEIIGRNAALVFTALMASPTMPSSICIGIHAGAPYFDTTEVFLRSLNRLVVELTDSRTRVFAPFLTWSKADIVSFARENNLPVQLTYSCEVANTPCGTCASCKDRNLLQC